MALDKSKFTNLVGFDAVKNAVKNLEEERTRLDYGEVDGNWLEDAEALRQAEDALVNSPETSRDLFKIAENEGDEEVRGLAHLLWKKHNHL